MSQALSSQRSWIARIAVLAMLASLMAFGAAPAGAAIDTSASCPDSIADAGFTDLAGVPAAAVDAINCIADYGISTGTTATTFDPFAEVARWQMALFITRQATAHGLGSALPAGTDQGFTDLGGVPAAAVTSINQIAELGISTGTSATTFDPFATVERWQMALFLQRLIVIAVSDNSPAVTLPDGSDQGFTDLAGVPTAAVTAINTIAQLDVADGTTATTFDPFAAVERWAMALFLARTLAADGITPPTEITGVGAPQLVRVTFDRSFGGDTRVIFEFDEDVAENGTGYLGLVGPLGTLTYPDDVAAGDADNEIKAIFSDDAWANAVAAFVEGDDSDGAAVDIDGNWNVPGLYDLKSVASSTMDWPADYPELVGITDAADYDEATDVVEFEFDTDVDVEAVPTPADYILVLANGDIETGTAVADGTAGDEFVEVTFAGLSEDDYDDVVRAFVLGVGAVDSDDDGTPNLHTGIDVASSGTTSDPDLVSVEIDLDNDTVIFTFDQNIDQTGALDDSAFVIMGYDDYDGDYFVQDNGTADFGDTAREIEVDYGTIDSDVIVYAAVLDGAVEGFNADPSTYDIVGPFSFSESAGMTVGPDLVSSVGSVVGLDDDSFVVTLTFDEDVDDWSGELWGWDADGDIYDLSGWDAEDIDDNVIELTFTTDSTELDALLDGDIVLFGYNSFNVWDVWTGSFYAPPASVGCNCPA